MHVLTKPFRAEHILRRYRLSHRAANDTSFLSNMAQLAVIYLARGGV